MPVANINGANINYEVLGDQGPWVVLTPGGRGAMAAVRPLGTKIAAVGHRVLLHDRRNCGASDVVIEGEDSEQEIWADDLHELLGQLDALPVFAGGGSAGCRLSLLLTLRHPASTRGLLLWWVTGGPVAAERLGFNYYGQFIEAAERGGMQAVCETGFFKERIEQNAANKESLLSMDPARFRRVMAGWREFFTAGAELPVIGATEAQLRGISVPTCIVPGNDAVHPRHVGENAHRLMPNSEIHYVDAPTVDVATLTAAEAQALMAQRQEQLAGIFTEFLGRVAVGVG